MHAQAPAQILMIEDQVSYGDAFGIALSLTDDFALVARAADGDAGTELCASVSPDLVICDYRLPLGDTGTAVAARLRSQGFEGPVVLLTGFAAPQVLREAAEIADVHVLSKDSGINDIVDDLRSILTGAGPSAATTSAPQAPSLSSGEMHVLELLNEGNSPATIAENLHLSLHTIRARIKAMHRKLDVRSQSEAIAVATRHGLVVPPT